jgi:hypothetical protein
MPSRRKGDCIGYVDLDKLSFWDGKSSINGEEVWTFVKGHGQCYIISSHGRIARVAGGRGARPGRLLKPAPEGKAPRPEEDYFRVQLSVDGVHSMRYVHRLVAHAFLLTEHAWCDVHHIDHNVQNNHLDNLEWQDSDEHRRAAWHEYQQYGGRREGRNFGADD